jgi:hypothetical protein
MSEKSTVSGELQAGALPSEFDPDDHIYEEIAEAAPGYYLCELPESFTLQDNMLPPRDQGSKGTCAAFAACAIKESQEMKDCGFDEYMSPSFIYQHRSNKPFPGASGRDIFKILQTVGSVPEKLYPYEESKDDTHPSAELYEIAAQYRIANFARITSCAGLQRALIEVGVCYLQLPLFNNTRAFWKSQRADERCKGNHAVAAVGYNHLGFYLRNSWGETWGDSGYTILPYDDWAAVLECWVCIDEHTDTKKLAAISARKPTIITASTSDAKFKPKRKYKQCRIM